MVSVTTPLPLTANRPTHKHTHTHSRLNKSKGMGYAISISQPQAKPSSCLTSPLLFFLLRFCFNFAPCCMFVYGTHFMANSFFITATLYRVLLPDSKKGFYVVLYRNKSWANGRTFSPTLCECGPSVFRSYFTLDESCSRVVFASLGSLCAGCVTCDWLLIPDDIKSHVGDNTVSDVSATWWRTNTKSNGLVSSLPASRLCLSVPCPLACLCG